MCNWTAWCTQNVLLTVFLGGFGGNTERRVFVKAAGSLDYFLKDYGTDGCCDEGAQYYRHAGLCLCNALEILTAVAGGALYSDEVNRINLYHRMQNIFYQKEVLDYDKPATTTSPP